MLVVVCITAAGISVAYVLPPVYRADAKILIESAQISTDLARSTVPEEITKQLQRVELQIMTRDNLLTLANDFGLYASDPSISLDEIIEDMRESLTVEPVLLNNSNSAGTIGLSVAFKASDPAVASNVVNKFTELMMQNNVNLRNNQAGDTLQFFQQEAEAYGRRLQSIEQKIVEFKNNHHDTLPENLAFRQAQQVGLQEQFSQLEREEAALQGERARTTQILRFGMVTPQRELNASEQLLEQLRRVLLEKRAIYSDTSPAIVALRVQIASLERETELQDKAFDKDSVEEHQRSETDLRLAEVTQKLALVPERKESLRTRLSELNESIAQTPATEAALRALEREHQNIQAQYSAMTTRLADAAVGQQIEVRSKGERLSVLERAVPPHRPIQPKRRLIAAGGLALGIALGIGLVVLLELLNSTVRRPADLVTKLGIEPLATIPYICPGGGVRPKMQKVIFTFWILATGLGAILDAHAPFL